MPLDYAHRQISYKMEAIKNENNMCLLTYRFNINDIFLLCPEISNEVSFMYLNSSVFQSLNIQSNTYL